MACIEQNIEECIVPFPGIDPGPSSKIFVLNLFLAKKTPQMPATEIVESISKVLSHKLVKLAGGFRYCLFHWDLHILPPQKDGQPFLVVNLMSHISQCVAQPALAGLPVA